MSEPVHPAVEIHHNDLWVEIPLIALRPGMIFRIRDTDGELATNQFGQPVIVQASSFPMVQVRCPITGAPLTLTLGFEPQVTEHPKETAPEGEATPASPERNTHVVLHDGSAADTAEPARGDSVETTHDQS